MIFQLDVCIEDFYYKVIIGKKVATHKYGICRVLCRNGNDITVQTTDRNGHCYIQKLDEVVFIK